MIHRTAVNAGHQNKLTTTQRIAWVDFAKATAIVLVVLYHVGGAGVDFLFPNSGGAASTFWAEVNQILLPLRMPLFFVTAGIVAHRAIGRRWATVWRSRIAILLWPYLLWSVGFACLAGFAYRPEDPGAYALIRLLGIPVAYSPYWFLAVLVLFFLVAKLLQQCARALLAATLILALAAPYIEAAIPEELPGALTYAAIKALQYSFWYFLGCYGAKYAEKIARMTPWPLVIGGGSSFVVLTYIAWSGNALAPLSVPLSATGLVAAVGLSVWAVRSDRLSLASKYLAGRTMPIYLLHPVLINAMVLVTVVFRIPVGPNDPWATGLTPLLTVVCVFLSVKVYGGILPTRFAWIYRPPAVAKNTESLPERSV